MKDEHPDLRLLRLARAMSLTYVVIEETIIHTITVGEALKFLGQPCGNNLNIKV